MLFHLNHDTECQLTAFVGRTQKAGTEDVPAVSFRLKMTSVPNQMLDLFSPTMRLTVYAPIEGQEQLPGVELTTPILRSKDLKHWAPETCLEGWTVVVARGITEESALQMGACKVDDFRFDFFEGGHMDVDFRVSTADCDEAGAGMLWGRQKRKVFVTVTPPEAPAKSAGRLPSRERRMVGVIDESGRFLGAGAFLAACDRPKALGVLGRVTKSSMVLFRQKPSGPCVS